MQRPGIMTGHSEFTTQQLLSLTQSALHGTVPDEKQFEGANETDWENLISLSAGQGVMAMALDGAMRLPKELQPPRTVKLRWVASVEAIEKRYQCRIEAAKELAVRFRENNIRMIIIKGLALSRLYPVPEHREFSDIDIYLCGKADEGDVILERIAKTDKPSRGKHSCFSYKGVLIENHHFLLAHSFGYNFHNSLSLEKRLTELLLSSVTAENPTGSPEEPYLFPLPDFDALFVMLHAITHFPAGIVLRHLCDLTALFTVHKGKIDFSLYQDSLSKAGLVKIADVFISLSVRFLGLNPEYAPPYHSDLPLEDKIWKDMLNPYVSFIPIGKRTFFNVVSHKLKLIRSRYWKNKLVFTRSPGKILKWFIDASRFYIRHPERIGKV